MAQTNIYGKVGLFTKPFARSFQISNSVSVSVEEQCVSTADICSASPSLFLIVSLRPCGGWASPRWAQALRLFVSLHFGGYCTFCVLKRSLCVFQVILRSPFGTEGASGMDEPQRSIILRWAGRKPTKAAQKLRWAPLDTPSVKIWRRILKIGREDDTHPKRWMDGEEWDHEGRLSGQTMCLFFQRYQELHAAVMKAIAVAIQLDPCFFDVLVSEEFNTLRLLYHPPIGKSTRHTVRAGAHCDFGSLTLLFQDDCGGLQMERPRVQGFLDVRPVQYCNHQRTWFARNLG